jgi:homoserine/homoserine lactone efflux protein
MPLSVWLAFLVACLAISFSPGPGAFAAMAAGLRNGFRRGYWVVIGLQLGIVAILAVVAAGVGALIVASTAAFEALRWAGVAYLAWLGVSQWGNRGSTIAEGSDGDRQTLGALLLRGLLVEITNPKALLFLLAVVPQFLDSGLPLPRQYMTLTATIVCVDMAVMAGYTILAARLLRFLKDPRHVRLISRAFGTLFFGAAVALALFRSS